jgi:hypothetical protein
MVMQVLSIYALIGFLVSMYLLVFEFIPSYRKIEKDLGLYEVYVLFMAGLFWPDTVVNVIFAKEPRDPS